uniref:Uncharacterized protein n=1 Tax=Rhizophora mucronata TaxID=61149 RepID=A0A2P2J510_RHIMU
MNGHKTTYIIISTVMQHKLIETKKRH